MKILVLGGSYFLGKHFVTLAKNEHDITVFNRGTRPLNFPQVLEIHGDRHDEAALFELKGQHYDAVVDFCAYQKNDISSIFRLLGGSIKQYIFISTCDVYRRGLNSLLDENAPYESRNFGGEAGDYILGKVSLEKELVENAKMYNVMYTSLRPAFIYGPDNYAPREGIYFHWIKEAGQILHPIDSTGEFQLVYVGDVAKAILCSLGNPKAFDRAYNLAPFKMETYETFSDALAEVFDIEFEKIPVSVQVISEKGIALPFPLTKEESNWYDGKKVLELIEVYTDLTDGLRETIGKQ